MLAFEPCFVLLLVPNGCKVHISSSGHFSDDRVDILSLVVIPSYLGPRAAAEASLCSYLEVLDEFTHAVNGIEADLRVHHRLAVLLAVVRGVDAVAPVD